MTAAVVVTAASLLLLPFFNEPFALHLLASGFFLNGRLVFTAFLNRSCIYNTILYAPYEECLCFRIYT